MGRFWFLYLSILDYIFILRAENLIICFLFFLSSSSFCQSRERGPRRILIRTEIATSVRGISLYPGNSASHRFYLPINQIRHLCRSQLPRARVQLGYRISAISQTWWREWHSFDHSKELKRLPIALNAYLFATRWCLQVEFRTFQRKKKFFFLLSCCKFSCEHFHF